MEEYHAAVRGALVTAAPIIAKEGHVSWLINLYKRSRRMVLGHLSGDTQHARAFS
jgi:hypothetical protein